jgi:hypothetical protein
MTDVSAFLSLVGADPVSVFHGVRRLPYHSSGDRSLAGILQSRRGSCSSKHILLAALLNRIGVRADVELAEGDFASPLKEARGISKPMSDTAREGIRDIHNVVRVWLDAAPPLNT